MRLTCPPNSGSASVPPPSDESSPPPPGGKPKPSSQHDASAASHSTRTLVERSVLLKPRGRLDAGMHRLTFTFPLVGIGGEPLLETYRGKYIEVVYNVSVRIERGVFSRTLEKKAEFAVRAHPTERPNDERDASLAGPVPIRITPSSVTEDAVNGGGPRNGSAAALESGVGASTPATVSAPTATGILPSFHIRGRLDSALWSLDGPITGEVAVASSAKPVKSVEVRLNRVEGVCRESGGEGGGGSAPTLILPGQCAPAASGSGGSGFVVSRTEVQTHRIAEGDVPRGVSLPVHMVLPRLLVCPTVTSGLAFRIGWELEVRVVFCDGTMVTEAYPVVLYR